MIGLLLAADLHLFCQIAICKNTDFANAPCGAMKWKCATIDPMQNLSKLFAIHKKGRSQKGEQMHIAQPLIKYSPTNIFLLDVWKE